MSNFYASEMKGIEDKSLRNCSSFSKCEKRYGNSSEKRKWEKILYQLLQSQNNDYKTSSEK